MEVAHNDTATISPGDTVQQVAPIGLSAGLSGLFYVVSAENGELELSMTPDGPPLADGQGHPRHFPCKKFRRIPNAA